MNQTWIIFAHDQCLQPGALRNGQPTLLPSIPLQSQGLTQLAAEVRRQMDQAGYDLHDILLALPSSWCLAATISTHGLQRAGRRRALAFRLEEHLPVSAENIVADYIPHQNHETLGICCETQKIHPLINALHAAGLPIRHLCPAAFLAAAHLAEQHPLPDAVLLANHAPDSTHFDLIELLHGKPRHWWWFADDLTSLSDRLQASHDERRSPLQLALLGNLPHSLPQLAHCPNGQITQWPLDPHSAAILHAAKLLTHTGQPWIDLRSDSLKTNRPPSMRSTPVITLILSLLTLLLSISCVMQWRGRRYASLAQDTLRQQIITFQNAMPNQQVPLSIRGRLLSERHRLAGLGGNADHDTAIRLDTTSAMSHLREILNSLPQDARFQITDFTIQPDLVRIEGRARSHAEAENLALAIRQTGRYDVDPPNTEAARDRGVTFVFTARPILAPSAKGDQP